MSQKLTKTKKVLKNALPTAILRERRTKAVISKFADDVGLVYFGYTNQRSDEHRLLRGLTVSHSHVDHHYSVGSFRGYDVALVVRREKLLASNQRDYRYWTIVTFDLTSSYDVPHLFMTFKSRQELLEAKYVSLSELPMIHSEKATKFAQEWRLYANIGQALEVQRLLNDSMLDGISNHFDHLAIEVAENTVYIYSALKHPTRSQLERQVSNGLWFTRHLDAAADTAKRQLEQ